jgi:predicted AAA+ superfamily ATPase
MSYELKRSIISKLKAWKTDERRKPLLVMGARQVGKTTILREFGRVSYQNVVYLNFEDTPSLKRLFEDTLKPTTLVNAIALELKVEILPGKSLIIFDEVQECPQALNSLKYFNENANEYHIAAAGSLLGVKLSHVKGFPVGKVDFLHCYPLSFTEFLEAMGEARLIDYMRAIRVIEPLPSNLHEKLLQLLKEYLYVGGMPEAVAAFASKKDFSQVSKIHQAILNAYSLDFAKHAPPEHLMKINQVWDSISGQLAKENKKFIYSIIRKGARAADFEVAIQWLKEAGLIHKVYHITAPKFPLDGYQQFDYFKIYLVDVGLLGAKSNLPANVLLHGNQLFQEFRGSLMENFVAESLVCNEYNLYYWASEGKAEIDFVLQEEDKIYPLEVKSGETNKKQSLRVYDQKYFPELLIRCSPLNLKRDAKLLNCPLYLIDQLRGLLRLNIGII